MVELLFSSEELDVSFLPGASDFLLVTFSALDFSTKTDAFWGRYFAEKNGISALGFVAKKNNWYPRRFVEEGLKSVMPRIRHMPRRITYGSSMGAYGAVKYSKVLGATACAAFSPQFSIDPADGITRSSYTSYFRPELHDGMAIRGQDVSANCYIFYDQTDDFDRGNAEYISKVAPGTRLVRIRNVGHEVIKVLGNAPNTIKLLKFCLEARDDEIHSLMRTLRARSPARYSGVATALALRNRKLAGKIFDKYQDRFDQKQRAIYFDVMAEACALSQEFELARAYIVKALEILPGRIPFLMRVRQIDELARKG
ncbi:hypothetical protein IVB18_38265 [Bradyrhizobium sp. 186]|uniref:hypothetical protein n=1 Tax=Bradyrhizobium sp. 186 TaxID=2782654 RepID=UPI002001C458|nr:hypothetical protein [Bradyrhizobium sp. 186]UPK33966.1 hypothetical protein IVB18_38265 [Bradyrhizobium sp. 186]